MSYSSEVLADSPLAYWRLNETTGIAAADETGNGRGGTFGGLHTLGQASPVAGGSAFRVDGSTGRMVVSGAAWMDVPTWTVEAWVKSPAGVNLHGIVTREPSTTPVASQYVFSLQTSGNKLAPVVFVGSTSKVFTSTATVCDGTWHHVAVSWDGTTIRMYVDGAPSGTGTPGGAISRSATVDMVVGNAKATTSSLSYGVTGSYFDEVAFYSGALSDARIAAHFTAASSAAGSVTASLPALTAAVQGAVVVQPATGALSGSLPALAGSASGLVQVLVESSTDYANVGSYNYTGVGTVDYMPPIAPTPARVRRVKVQRVHQSLPAPTLVDGRPV